MISKYARNWLLLSTVILAVAAGETGRPVKGSRNEFSLPYVFNYYGKQRASNWICCSSPPSSACLARQRPRDCPSCAPCLPPLPAQTRLGSAIQVYFNNDTNVRIDGGDDFWPGIPSTVTDELPFLFPANPTNRPPNGPIVDPKPPWDFVMPTLIPGSNSGGKVLNRGRGQTPPIVPSRPGPPPPPPPRPPPPAPPNSPVTPRG